MIVHTLKSRKFVLMVLLALGVLPIAPVYAHGIWFAQRANQLALIYGMGADDLDLVRRVGQLEGVAAYDVDYRIMKAEIRIAGPLVVVDASEQPTLVVAVLQNGIWSKMEGGEFERKTLEEMPGAAVSERTIKYAVTVQGRLKSEVPSLPGQTLQIIPVGKIPEKLGASMIYRVLFSGKPIAGAHVINDMVNDPDAVPASTRDDGTVTLPVRNQGLNVIRAVYFGPSDEPRKYKRIEHTATLAFTLAHEPE
jgi:hypothetical protein